MNARDILKQKILDTEEGHTTGITREEVLCIQAKLESLTDAATIRTTSKLTYTEEQFQAVLDERKEIVERIGSENTALRQRNYALKAAVKRLLDESWNGPIDAEHPVRTYASGLLANDQTNPTR